MEMSLSISTTGGTKAGKIWWHRLLGFLPPSNWNQLGQLASAPAPENTAGHVGLEINIGWANIFFLRGNNPKKWNFLGHLATAKGHRLGKSHTACGASLMSFRLLPLLALPSRRLLDEDCSCSIAMAIPCSRLAVILLVKPLFIY